MTIYRVYESYHDSSESGTHEYGYYTDLERAKQRARAVWKQKDYPEEYSVSEMGELSANNGFHWTSISIREIEVDTDLDQNMCGYT